MKTPVTELLERVEGECLAYQTYQDAAVLSSAEILKLTKLVRVYRAALTSISAISPEYIDDPRHFKEVIASNALDKGEKIASGGTNEKGGGG